MSKVESAIDWVRIKPHSLLIIKADAPVLRIFHGWRRKVGVATLVLACAFMGAWIRSLTILDFIVPLSTATFSIVIVSSGSEVDFYLLQQPSGGYLPVMGWQRAGAEQELADLWRIQNQHHPGMYSQRVPYWSIVVPLTLLSAYFLLRNTTAPAGAAVKATS